MASPDSKFSKEERDLIVQLKARPKRLVPGDPLFESMLREIATGRSVGILEIGPCPPNLKVT
jgi:hypothetical protein